MAASRPATPPRPRHLAYLKIAEGCGHGCTFCLIPQIRGKLRSRPLNTLVQEAENLAAAGVKELILVAQDTTAYGRDKPGGPGIAALLREVAAIDGFRWIRLLYGHPARITPELLAIMAANPRILPYLDIPIQHGHDEVLRRMGRGYGRRDILETVRRIREALPGATLRTTVMAGFPGETEAHFQTLADLITEVGFDHLGVFLYSPEAGTPAAAFRPQVPRREARRRARLLKAIQAKIVKARLKSLVGTVARGPGGRGEPGERLPAHGTHEKPGPGHRRPGLYHRRDRAGGGDSTRAPHPGPALRPAGGDCRGGEKGKRRKGEKG